MGPTATTAGLELILLLLEVREILGGAHSLCLNLTVRAQASPEQPWCEAQGSLDGRPFLQYDNDSSKATPLGFLGGKVKDTKVWGDLTQTLEEMGRELRMVLLVIKLEKNVSSGLPSLKAKLCCQREAGQCTGASWEFNIKGETALIDTMTMNWTVIDPGARGVKEEWENNQNLAEYFRTISTLICCNWITEFSEHWEPELKPTVIPLDNYQSSSSPLIKWIILPITICFFILVILIMTKRRRKRHKQLTMAGP